MSMLIGLVPVFNEEENVLGVLDKLERQVGRIVIVNDGSFDKTDLLISKWVKDRENASYLSFKKNKGMSHALRQGFIYISEQCKKGIFSLKDVIVTVDGDGQHDPDTIKYIYEYFNNNNLDALIVRRDFSNYPRYRILGNKLISLVASHLGGFKFNDIESGFKILKISLVKDLLKYYIGIRYSCACEIGLIASLLDYKIDNSYSVKIPFYRNRGPTFIDLLLNTIFCSLVFLRIRLSQK